MSATAEIPLPVERRLKTLFVSYLDLMQLVETVLNREATVEQFGKTYKTSLVAPEAGGDDDTGIAGIVLDADDGRDGVHFVMVNKDFPELQEGEIAPSVDATLKIRS